MNLKTILTIAFFALFISTFIGQNKATLLTGKVSFVNSKNIYVKFENTSNIKVGDTLRLLNIKNACLLVQNKSSKSVVCISLLNCNVKKDDVVYFKNVEESKDSIIEENEKKIEFIETNTIIDHKKNIDSNENSIERIRGKISAASYSNFSPSTSDSHRMMYRFSLDAQHINDSKISLETYLNYRQYFQSKDNTSSLRDNVFNVYNLALKYDIDSTFSFVVGRKINNKTSSLGAIDGLQVEKYFGNKFIGVIVGFRPDINEYNFNANLLEYGGYIGSVTTHKYFQSETTLGVLQQTNNGQIDRRYAYFQHSSSILKNLYLFSSMEFDIYSKSDSIASNSIELTNLYTSAKYRFGRKLDVMVSYDSRKRILYYETFQTEIERLLDDNEARQGLRFRLNVKPTRFLFAGASYSKRFQSSTQNKSNNINAYLNTSKIPVIGGSFSINFNKNTSNYLESNILSFRHSRELVQNKLSADFYVRLVEYNYLNTSPSNTQNYYGTNLAFSISKNLKLNVFGEMSITPKEKNDYRINASITQRFKNKKSLKKINYDSKN